MAETKQEAKHGTLEGVWKVGYADGSGRDTITCNEKAQAEVWDRDGKGLERAWMICRAVNSHEILVEALEYLLKTYKANYNEGETTPAIRRAEAALQAAKQGR
jgi:hypothetical protein